MTEIQNIFEWNIDLRKQGRDYCMVNLDEKQRELLKKERTCLL